MARKKKKTKKRRREQDFNVTRTYYATETTMLKQTFGDEAVRYIQEKKNPPFYTSALEGDIVVFSFLSEERVRIEARQRPALNAFVWENIGKLYEAAGYNQLQIIILTKPYRLVAMLGRKHKNQHWLYLSRVETIHAKEKAKIGWDMVSLYHDNSLADVGATFGRSSMPAILVWLPHQGTEMVYPSWLTLKSFCKGVGEVGIVSNILVESLKMGPAVLWYWVFALRDWIFMGWDDQEFRAIEPTIFRALKEIGEGK